MSGTLDVFEIHRDIMDDYKQFVGSFINIRDNAIKAEVDKGIAEGKFWPEPLIGFNPSFEKGETLDDLCNQGIIHPELKEIFKGFTLYKHQAEAITPGCRGLDFIVTSGTGSGKSLTFLAIIYNFLLKNEKRKGVKAIIVYPMNALINSQFEAIEANKTTYENTTGKVFPFSFARYTGQESQQERDKVRDEFPDIILTNYMMLELILTRPQESSIRESIYENLKFLVFDELHTYRGRQGADVALLVARIKAQARHPLSCIGTSATMVSGGTLREQKLKVAEIAGKILGSRFSEEQIIDESLARCFQYDGARPVTAGLKEALEKTIDPGSGEAQLVSFPLSAWLENTIALQEKEGRLTRNKPLRLSEIVRKLADDSGVPLEQCESQLKLYLKWISNVNEKSADNMTFYLPYKIHQFISQTGSVYASLHQGERIISLDPIPFKKKGDENIPLYPVVFSRESGHEFICVTLDFEKGRLKPRELGETDGDEDEENITAGYIIPSPEVWDPGTDMELLPEAWVKTNRQGELKPTESCRDKLPRKIYYDNNGNFSFDTPLENEGWFMTAKLLFDPTSGVIYDPRTSENTKLTRLGSEGRSTSTTVLAFSILKQLAGRGLGKEGQKVLSFTDNRQDAALQAGHFNDFLKVIQLRSAIYHALENNEQLDHANLDRAVFDALKLDQKEYARNYSDFPGPMRDNENAFRHYLMYRALYDLRFSWRVTLPNLEQCALLEIHYKHLQENCGLDSEWQEVPFLNNISPSERQDIIHRVLDYSRKSYALQSEEYLSRKAISEKGKVINERLRRPWKFEENEEIREPYYMCYRPIKSIKKPDFFITGIGPNSALGKYLREEARHRNIILKGQDYMNFIGALMKVMTRAGWLEETRVKPGAGADDDTGTCLYRLKIDQVIWKKGDGKNMIPDLVKKRTYKGDITSEPNRFFQEMYTTDFNQMKSFTGHEHTGQLNNEDRKQREEDFRKGDINALFCSPTMELGIDIKTLDVVHMRNVPPGPANYAQRGGRAGRNGQAALVFTSCSNYSPHDRHYFLRQTDMVAGVVAPPKLDLDNRDLVKAHLNALFLSKAGIADMQDSLMNLLDPLKPETLPLKPAVEVYLKLNPEAKKEIKEIFERIVLDIKKRGLLNAPWLNERWITDILDNAHKEFDRALDRWRKMFKDAKQQWHEAVALMDRGVYTSQSKEYRDAHAKQHQAANQMAILENSTKTGAQSYSEFYPYRYLAAEGFLPGYNFTRLPVRAYIPIGDSGEYVSRPKFIALREFGPNNIIYHNGAKFKVDQILLTEIENKLTRAKVSKNSGYILMDNEYTADNCPFTGVSLTDGSRKEIFVDLLPMAETRTVEIDRISCAEEERMSRGYDIETFFSVPAGMDSLRKAKVKNNSQDFLNLTFIPSAQLTQINKKWRISRQAGFLIGLRSGLWKKAAAKKKKEKNEKNEAAEEERMVQLYTTDTADALYIEPIKALALTRYGVITLMYALKRAIENIFQVEPSEIDVELMGDEKNPNIFIYENAEGSLGILSQFISDKDIFSAVIAEAYNLCRFHDPDYLEQASYDDLLSYYNQRHHDIINRFEIKDALEKLKLCGVELLLHRYGFDYDNHYRDLLTKVDLNSEMETRFLNYLYRQGLRLPDGAQVLTGGIYCRPDFYYEPDIHLFCDGTPHDNPETQELDKKRREAIRNRGGQVLVWNYRERLEDFIAGRPDIFKKTF